MTTTQKKAAKPMTATTPVPAPKAPRPIKTSEILGEMRDQHQLFQEMFQVRASRLAEQLAAVIAHGYDIGRVIANGQDAVEPQMRAAMLGRAISRLEGGAVRGANQTFAERLANVREEAEFELKGVLRNRPWESSSTCQITNVVDRAKLSGRVAAHEWVKGRADRYLDGGRFVIEDDVTEVGDGESEGISG
jgi:hypothetical protein